MASVTNDSRDKRHKRHKRHNRSTEAVSNDVDRISNLPESVISHILSLLPTEDAVATSFLSTKWKFLWRDIHNLRFDDTARHFNQPQHTTNEQNSLFANFVNKVLRFLDRKSIDKFSLRITQFGDAHCVNTWIATAVSLKPSVIKWNCYRDDIVYFDMPCSLFTCETLKVLKLSGRINLNVPNLVSLPNVKTLSLKYVIYQCDECVVKLISGCSSLENLYVQREEYDNVFNFRISSPTLRNITLKFANHEYEDESFPEEFYYSLAINAPQLRYFELSSSFLLEDYFLENLCLLDEAKLDLCYDSNVIEVDDYSKAIVKVFQGIYNVKKLSCMGDELEDLSEARFSPSFLRLSELTILTTACWSTALLNIFGKSKKLESLTISELCDMRMDYERWRNPKKVPSCFSSCLKTISIEGFLGQANELKMLAYVLKNSKVLTTITIQPSSFLDNEGRFKLLQKVSTFCRGSVNCELHFLDH